MTSKFHLDLMRSSFFNMLQMHANMPACWYNIQHYSALGGQNLSSYLGLDDMEYLDVLLLLGLAKRHGKSVRIQRDEWMNLEGLSSSELSFELKVTPYYHKECPRMLWVRLGGAHQSGIGYHPGNQPESIRTFGYLQLERKYRQVGVVDERSKLIYAKEKLLEMEAAEREALKEAEAGIGDEMITGSDDDDGLSRYDDGEKTIEIDGSSYPYLYKASNRSHFKPSTLYGLLRDIVRLSKEYKDEFKLEYELNRGDRRKLIIVPKITTDASFRKNARPILEQMAEGFISDSYCEKKGKKDHLDINIARAEEKKVITRRIIEHYCTSYPDIVKEVANDRGFNFEDKKMDKHYAAAMFCESGIGPGKARIINRYLTAFFNRRLMVSENEIFRDKNLALDELPPEIKVQHMPDRTKLNYYVKPLDKIISLGLKKKIKRLKNGDEEKINRVDISWSADHGGGFFRAIVKCAATVDENRLIFTHRVGQMQCKSDKYDVVYKTMGKYLNKGITSILENDGVTPKSINVYVKQNQNERELYVLPQGDNDTYSHDEQYELVTRIPSNRIKIAITGDMAFYSTMLGKPNMDSCWCTWCDASAREWATTAIVKGNAWTRQKLIEKLIEVQRKPKMDAYKKKGVKEKPILKVDPSLFVPPPLHLKLGLVNRAFIKPDGYSYFSWSQKRVENIPQSEQIAFNLYRESMAEVEDRLQDVILFDLQNPKETLDDMKERKFQTQSELKKRALTVDQRATLEQDLACIQYEIDEFQSESNRRKLNLKEARKRKTQTKKDYESEKKKRTYHSRLIQNQKEMALKDLGIDRGASHGGDLQGRGCTNLLQRADEFFDRCRQIDLEAVERGTALASREEVEQINRHFKQLAIMMDKLFHFINMTHEEVEAYEGNDFITDVHKHVKTFIWLWNYLRLSMKQPKLHTVKDHLVDSFRKWNAIGPYNEEFTESDHVRGNAETRLFGALRDPQLREEAVSKRAAIMEHPKVQEHIENFSSKAKRKRMSDNKSVSIKRRREEVLEEVHALKEHIQNSGKEQISDYWNQSTA